MKIKKDGLGWYKISTGRNWGEKRARKYIVYEFPVKRALRSLIASGESWQTARYIISRIQKAAKDSRYDVYAAPGCIVIKGY